MAKSTSERVRAGCPAGNAREPPPARRALSSLCPSFPRLDLGLSWRCDGGWGGGSGAGATSGFPSPSFQGRGLVPTAPRGAPACSPTHRLGLSHLQVRSFNSSCLALQRESVFLQEHLHVSGSCTNKCFLRSEQGPQGFSCLARSFFGLHSHLLCWRKLISPMCWLW